MTSTPLRQHILHFFHIGRYSRRHKLEHTHSTVASSSCSELPSALPSPAHSGDASDGSKVTGTVESCECGISHGGNMVSDAASQRKTQQQPKIRTCDLHKQEKENVCRIEATVQMERMLCQEGRYREGFATYRKGLCCRSCEKMSCLHRIRSWRKTACYWCFEVVDKLNFQRELVSIAMSYIDRYIILADEEELEMNEREFRLLSLTSLFLAIKVHRPETVPISCYTSLCKDIKLEEIIAMESRVGFRLEWMMHPPTAVSFARLILRAMASDDQTFASKEVRDEVALHAYFISELTEADVSFTTFKPSNIAFSCVLASIERYYKVKGDILANEDWRPTIMNVCGDLFEIDCLEIEECRNKIRRVPGAL